jgi:hypothetical protein
MKGEDLASRNRMSIMLKILARIFHCLFSADRARFSSIG